MEAFQGVVSGVIGALNGINGMGIAALSLLVALALAFNNARKE